MPNLTVQPGDMAVQIKKIDLVRVDMKDKQSSTINAAANPG